MDQPGCHQTLPPTTCSLRSSKVTFPYDLQSIIAPSVAPHIPEAPDAADTSLSLTSGLLGVEWVFCFLVGLISLVARSYFLISEDLGSILFPASLTVRLGPHPNLFFSQHWRGIGYSKALRVQLTNMGVASK